jgi:two-component system, sensor histidine kinase and response regulator
MPQGPDSSATILVVDDNEQNLALAQASLEEESYSVVLARNGPEAIRAFEAKKPGCVLLDVRMPGMSGFEVCEALRRLPGGAETPVVFLTAQRDVDTFDAALRAGGDDFLTKPVRPTELVLRVQAALRLKRLNTENREYLELARRQRDDLMRLQLQKERLTAFVVHDLKNPVSNLDLQAQVLLRDKELPARLRPSIDGIRSEARALMRLIMNLLDIAKSEEGRLAPKTSAVGMRALVDRVFSSLDASAKSREVRLESSLAADEVRADPDLFQRVLENLLDNALRHAPEDSVVRVASEERDGRVEIRVEDSGRGVPPEMRERIFDPFVQVESGDRSVTRSGRGLGLAFCRIAVEAQGGTIRVEDRHPGASFLVSLPHG